MKIGIVNDTLLAAEALRRTIAAGSQHEIIWIARSGEDAIARCAKDLPDAVLMDGHCSGGESQKRCIP